MSFSKPRYIWRFIFPYYVPLGLFILREPIEFQQLRTANQFLPELLSKSTLKRFLYSIAFDHNTSRQYFRVDMIYLPVGQNISSVTALRFQPELPSCSFLQILILRTAPSTMVLPSNWFTLYFWVVLPSQKMCNLFQSKPPLILSLVLLSVVLYLVPEHCCGHSNLFELSWLFRKFTTSPSKPSCLIFAAIVRFWNFFINSLSCPSMVATIPFHP